MAWYQILLLIIGTNAITAGIMLYFFKKKELASFIITLFGLAISIITLILPSNRSEQNTTSHEDSVSNPPIKTSIPLTYQPQVVLDNGTGSIYLYKWDYIKGNWTVALASDDELKNLEIYKTVITFDGQYDYHYHAYLAIPGYTDTIDLNIPASPCVLRTTKGEFEFIIGTSYSSDMSIKEIFDVSSDSTIEIDDSKLSNQKF